MVVDDKVYQALGTAERQQAQGIEGRKIEVNHKYS